MLFLTRVFGLILKDLSSASGKTRLARLLNDFALRDEFHFHDLNMKAELN